MSAMRDEDYIKVEIIDGKKYGYVVTNWDEFVERQKQAEAIGLCRLQDEYWDYIFKDFKFKYRLEEIIQ